MHSVCTDLELRAEEESLGNIITPDALGDSSLKGDIDEHCCTDVSNDMARDRLGSDYSENMSDATTCSCTTNSIDKCSLRSCGMFHEPFFLHPPGTRPRDGIYINPMSAFIAEPAQKPRDNGESFYLHSPHDLVYTRITHLFCDTDKPRNGGERVGIERKDETLTVKVDVHINNGNYKPVGNGNSIRSDSIKDSGSGTEHAYEQICIRPEENDSVHSSSQKKLNDASSESGRSRTVGRRFSRSSSVSESSNISSELHCYSSTTSTPSLSRNSSNERVGKIPKPPTEPPATERKSSTTIVTSTDIEKETKTSITGPSIVKPPPPPPPPPPPDGIDDIPFGLKIIDSNGREEKRDKDAKSETSSTASSAAIKSDVSCEQQPEVQASSTSSDTEDGKASQVSHLVNRHMVLPFIPPKFTNAADSNTLLKPSEYLKSICKSSTKKSLSKARSVDNLDIQSRTEEEEEEEVVQQVRISEEVKTTSSGPPPPPLPPMPTARDVPASPVTPQDPESPKIPQPLATISIQDLTSVQLRRTNIKMHATKTFSAPPPRSVSMTNVSEPFFVQKTDLIAELKKTRDIPGIKKLKVERAKVEKTQEQNMITEISKAFSVTNFVDQIPEKDSSGNVIPIWKRQMLARKAAERAKKELEEQIAKENEEKRQQAIPPWKRQLLAKKDCDEKKPSPTPPPPALIVPPPVKIEIAPIAVRDSSPAAVSRVGKVAELDKVENEGKKSDNDDEDDAPIIPWRAQLRKTNSKLNIID